MKPNKEQTEITIDTIVQRNTEQEFSIVDDEVVMFSPENGEYYSLNTIASRIWELIQDKIEVKALTDLLLQEFEVKQETCINDTIECLNSFKKRSIIKTEKVD